MGSIQRKLELAGKNRTKKLYDNEIHYVGSDLKTIRLKVIEDQYGDEEWTVISSDVIEVSIDNWGEIPMNKFRGASSSTQSEGLYLWDILPIEMNSKFNDNIEVGDLLIFIMEIYDKKIPVLFKVSEDLTTLNHLVRYKKHYISMYNGTLPTVIKNEIDTYIDDFVGLVI
jgi:hypothetical protein